MKIAMFLFVMFSNITLTHAGESPNIGDIQVFPQDNPWNWDISAYDIHPNSDNFIDSIGPSKNLHPDFGTQWQGVPNGIPYIVVNNAQPLISIVYTRYGNESDPGPFPIPLAAPIEGGSSAGGDRHVLAVDTDNLMLYELYKAYPADDGWEAYSGASFDLTRNDLRPAGWTSADAAGLPIFPGLVRYEEVYIKKEINHALRFTVSKSRREYIYPARHFASESDDPDYAPMGLRLRLKADFDVSGFSEPVQVILRALKKYGMFVADNGSDWFISGAPDDRWDDDILGELKSIKGHNFEVVKTVNEQGDPIFPSVTFVNNDIPVDFEFKLENYPNPFNAITKFEFRVSNFEFVSLKVYNILGKEVAVLVNDKLSSGNHIVQWDAGDLASGVYFYQLQVSGTNNTFVSATKRMLLIK